MCEIFFISKTTKENIKEVFEQILLASDHNQDGFGLFTDKYFYKSPKQLKAKDLTHFLRCEGHKFLVAHVRFSTSGQNNYENTHPFRSDNFVFCHNGVVDGGDAKHCDSYYLFQGIKTEKGNDLKKINKAIKEKTGSYSCFLYNIELKKLYYFRQTSDFHFAYLPNKGVFGMTRKDRLKNIFNKRIFGVFKDREPRMYFEPKENFIYLVNPEKHILPLAKIKKDIEIISESWKDSWEKKWWEK